jgi:DNA-binding transcriptional MerR regulator
MSDGALTIGQLADFTGVTVRAIRHYHQRGLLPEPPRDRSGYRRYDAQAVLHLLRIKVLADAGVPLARIEEVLDGDPERFARSLREIDATLREQIKAMECRRRRIAELADGDRALLSPELVAYLEELRRLGVSPGGVALERDGWVLLFARFPQRAPEWLSDKRAHLADPEFRRLTRLYDAAAGWKPSDPRLDELASAMIRYAEAHAPAAVGDLDDPATLAVLGSLLNSGTTPALDRLHKLVEEADRPGNPGKGTAHASVPLSDPPATHGIAGD